MFPVGYFLEAVSKVTLQSRGLSRPQAPHLKNRSDISILSHSCENQQKLVYRRASLLYNITSETASMWNGLPSVVFYKKKEREGKKKRYT